MKSSGLQLLQGFFRKDFTSYFRLRLTFCGQKLPLVGFLWKASNIIMDKRRFDFMLKNKYNNIGSYMSEDSALDCVKVWRVVISFQESSNGIN